MRTAIYSIGTLCVLSVFSGRQAVAQIGTSQALHFEFDFADGLEGWSAGFADYPGGEEEFYELDAEHRPLPAEIATGGNGFFVTGNNHSDDLWMFIKRRIDGLTPNAEYTSDFRVTFATNAPADCLGVGGAPGSGVTMKVGATMFEPLALPCTIGETPDCDGDGILLMNLDKGNQSQGGRDMQVVGHIGNDNVCPDDTYVLKTLESADDSSFTVQSDADGSLWAIVGTDSAFEATTSLYYATIEIVLEETERPDAFQRGDANGDSIHDLSDAVATLFHLFRGLPLSCLDSADANDDGSLEASDAVFSLSFLFLGGPAFPDPAAPLCGADPTADDLGCAEYAPCVVAR